MRSLVAVVAVVVLTLAPLGCSTGSGYDGRSGTSAATSTTLLPGPGGVNSAIGPRPFEEVPPRSRDDRGGWLQLSVGAAIVLGLGALGGLAWRDARRRSASRQG